MSEAEQHVFTRRTASPALKREMDHLALHLGRTVESMEGLAMGEAFRLAKEAFGGALPEFWVVWNDWNTAPEQPPSMGDL